MFSFEGEILGDHCDELRIRGLALDAGDRVAEELLQGLHVAAVPRDLDGVADFRDYRPERMGALWKVFSLKSMNVIYRLVCWFEYLLFIALF